MTTCTRVRAVLLVAALAVALPAAAGPNEDVTAATHAWKTAYDSRDPKQLLALYAPEAVFWGTSSPVLRDTPEMIADYFRTAPNQPNARVEFGEFKVRVWGDIAASTGSYTFTDVRPDGTQVRRPARFSLTYRRIDGKWLIVDHHSSSAPAAPGQPAPGR